MSCRCITLVSKPKSRRFCIVDFLDTPIFFSTIAACSRNSILSFVKSGLEDDLRSGHSSPARNTQIPDAEMVSPIHNIRVSSWWKKQSLIMPQETTVPPLTYRHADDLPLSGEDEAFQDVDGRLHVTHSEVQRMTDSAILRYEKSTLKRLRDAVIQHNMKALPRTSARETTMEFFIPLFRAMEDIFTAGCKTWCSRKCYQLKTC